MKLSWPFGTVFLEKYGYDLVEMDDEVELSRNVKAWQVTVKFASSESPVRVCYCHRLFMRILSRISIFLSCHA